MQKHSLKNIGLLKEVGINPIIVIHGGGPQIAKMLKMKKIKNKFMEGLRVTNEETIKVVEKVLSKDINSKIVDDISATGGKAIGLSGHLNNIIEAEKLEYYFKR